MGATAKTCFSAAEIQRVDEPAGANLNRLPRLAAATACAQALTEHWVPRGLLDQFSEQPLTQRELAKKGVKNFELKMRTKAEEDPVVAAASIVARAEYVRQCTNSRGASAGNSRKGAARW